MIPCSSAGSRLRCLVREWNIVTLLKVLSRPGRLDISFRSGSGICRDEGIMRSPYLFGIGLSQVPICHNCFGVKSFCVSSRNLKQAIWKTNVSGPAKQRSHRTERHKAPDPGSWAVGITTSWRFGLHLGNSNCDVHPKYFEACRLPKAVVESVRFEYRVSLVTLT